MVGRRGSLATRQHKACWHGLSADSGVRRPIVKLGREPKPQHWDWPPTAADLAQAFASDVRAGPP